MNGMLCFVIPLDGELPGFPGGPPRPDQGLPGGGPPLRPTHPIIIPPSAIAPDVPEQPIYLPPAIWPPITVAPPGINHPAFPSQLPMPGGGGPVDPGWGHTPPVDPGFGNRPPVDPGYGINIGHRPSHPIVYPPGLPDNSLPPTPGLPPLIPTHPIVLPERPEGVHGALVIPLPEAEPKLETPSHAPDGAIPCIVCFPGYLPTLAWMAPPAQPKSK